MMSCAVLFHLIDFKCLKFIVCGTIGGISTVRVFLFPSAVREWTSNSLYCIDFLFSYVWGVRMVKSHEIWYLRFYIIAVIISVLLFFLFFLLFFLKTWSWIFTTILAVSLQYPYGNVVLWYNVQNHSAMC